MSSIKMGHLSRNLEGALELSCKNTLLLTGKQQCHNQRLVDLFVEIPPQYRNVWLNRPVMYIEDQWRNTRDVGLNEPDTVRITFHDGPVLQYTSRCIVCDIASALQECSDWKPSDVMESYLLQYRKIEHIALKGVISREDASFADLVYKDPSYPDLEVNKDGGIKTLTSEETAKAIQEQCMGILIQKPGTRVAEPDIGYRTHDILESTYAAIYGTDVENKPTRFSDAPFKVIRDYLYACSFLSPFAKGFVDYANDLLAYRLSYAISQEKDIPAQDAITNLARELNDFAKNHADGAWGLRASTKVEMFSGRKLPSLTVRSDFGIITVDYEPALTMLDWENRYAALRTRHAG